jgi:hypothetical protein
MDGPLRGVPCSGIINEISSSCGAGANLLRVMVILMETRRLSPRSKTPNLSVEEFNETTQETAVHALLHHRLAISTIYLVAPETEGLESSRWVGER